jgi:hypothetical protein
VTRSVHARRCDLGDRFASTCWLGFSGIDGRACSDVVKYGGAPVLTLGVASQPSNRVGILPSRAGKAHTVAVLRELPIDDYPKAIVELVSRPRVTGLRVGGMAHEVHQCYIRTLLIGVSGPVDSGLPFQALRV